MLREFAARFRRNTRGIDLACRVGGEEFIIIMPETTLEKALQVGERLSRLHRVRALPGQSWIRACA